MSSGLQASGSSSSSSSTWPRKLEEAQRLANEGARLEFAKDYSAAFASYVRAGETYLWLARTYDQEVRSSTTSLSASIDNLHRGDGLDLKARIRKAAEKVLNRAQLIKSIKRDNIRPVERRVLSDEEQLRALEFSSSVGGVRLPVWKKEPHKSTFTHVGSTTTTSRRFPAPTLAPLHVEGNATFRKRADRPFWAEYPLCNGDPCARGSDIVQDVINDCSFVASLEVAAEYDEKWGTHLAHAPLYPKDDSTGLPAWSANGQHLVRLRFNGVDRALEIDDAIPCDARDTPMCAIALVDGSQSRNPTLSEGAFELWPALLEKAYLSLRGGYDFKGSNSSIDLHALIGWIPDHVGFHHAGFQREKMWARILSAFSQGNILLTAGTSRTTERSNQAGRTPLINSHNYAILDVVERGTERHLTLMNPWRRDGGRSQQPRWTDELRSALPPHVEETSVKPEVFTMSWDEACARLDSMYISWNPNMFQHQTTMHAFWTSPEKANDSKSTLLTSAQNTQVVLAVANSTSQTAAPEVWLHLVRHVTKQESADLSTEWIAIHAFDGQNDTHLHDQKFVGTYVDSTHALLRFTARKAWFRVVASRQVEKKERNDGIQRASDASANDSTFSITAYSNTPIHFEEVQTQYPFVQKLSGQWTSRSAGGNALQSTFMHNPQYTVTVPKPTNAKGEKSPGMRLRIVVEASRDVTVQAMLVWRSSDKAMDNYATSRIDHIAPGDVVCSSGPYSYGLAIAESDAIRSDTPYVLIVSTYTAGQQGDFTITIQTQHAAADVKAIPAEGAGMHQYRMRDRWSISTGTAAGAPRRGRYAANPSYLVEVTRATSILARLVVATPRPGDPIPGGQPLHRSRPHINLAVLENHSRREVVSSGPYADNGCGVAICKMLLEPGTYVLVASTFDADVEAEFTLFIFGDRALTVKKIV